MIFVWACYWVYCWLYFVHYNTGPQPPFRQLMVWHPLYSRQNDESMLEISPPQKQKWHLGWMMRRILTSSGLPCLNGRSNLPPVAGALELQPSQSRQISSHSQCSRLTLRPFSLSGQSWYHWTLLWTSVGPAKRIFKQGSGTNGAGKLVMDLYWLKRLWLPFYQMTWWGSTVVQLTELQPLVTQVQSWPRVMSVWSVHVLPLTMWVSTWCSAPLLFLSPALW